MADDDRTHLFELLRQFDTAMLVTCAADGALRARPMALADSQPDGHLWFASGDDTAKCEEIAAEPRVCVVLQSKHAYLSLSGTATIVRDRAKAAELWREAWKLWFPAGKDDPNLILIRVDATTGEYWDTGGANQLKLGVEAVRALIKGEQMQHSDEEHGKVRL